MWYNWGMKRFLMISLVMGLTVVMSLAGVPAMAVSEAQEQGVKENCDTIKEVLKNVQKDDARARVYLGAYYEAILSNFITPLNVRLVENNLSEASLVENQNKFAAARSLFVDDYVSYQQRLEELVAMDCKTKPKEFYEKLEKVRQKRKVVEQDALKIRGLTSEHVKLVEQLKGKV